MYQEIKKDQMDTALPSFNSRIVPTIHEFVYDKQVAYGVTIRVYSSISIHSLKARACGKDAIRVCAVRGEKGWIKSINVHRTNGWRSKLKRAISSIETSALKRVSQTYPVPKKVKPMDIKPFNIPKQNAVPSAVKEVWLRDDENKMHYTTEASDLDGMVERSKLPRNICPHCAGYFTKKHMTHIDWLDANHEDIAGWNFKHTCGAELLVIND